MQGPRGAARPARCATPASTWTSTAATATRSSTRTPTTRCGSPTSSCRPWSTTPTGTCGPSPPARSSRRVPARDLMRQIAEATWECADPGMQFDTTINRWHTAANTGRINGSNPCSRVHAPRQLGVQPGRHQPADSSSTTTTARSTSRASSTPSRSCSPPRRSWSAAPTTRPSAIGETSRAFRQLGLGYANLGALLMALGLPYDSDDGRAWAGGDHRADDRPRLRHVGPHRRPHGPVRRLRRQRGAHAPRARHAPGRGGRTIDEELVPAELLGAAQQAWDDAVRARRAVRRAQLAGHRARAHRHHRPDDGLRHHRHRARPRPLQDEEAGRRRHDDRSSTRRCPVRCAASATTPEQIDEIVAYIDEHKTDPRRAPRAPPTTSPVFACSMGDNAIHYLGPRADDGGGPAVHQRRDLQDREHARGRHGRRRRAAPHRRLAARASRRSPSTATTARSPSRSSMAKKDQKHGDPAPTPPPQVVTEVVETDRRDGDRQGAGAREAAAHPRSRRRSSSGWPTARASSPSASTTTAARASCSSRSPSRARPWPGSWTRSPSRSATGLQYGVPLRAFVEAFTNMRFEPAGMTDDPDIRIASSLRRLHLPPPGGRLPVASRSGPSWASSPSGSARSPRCPASRSRSPRAAQGDWSADPQSIPSASELAASMEQRRPGASPACSTGPGSPTPPRPAQRRPCQPKQQHADAPYCMQCGVQMQRAGSCHACPSCGSTSGCS